MKVRNVHEELVKKRCFDSSRLCINAVSQTLLHRLSVSELYDTRAEASWERVSRTNWRLVSRTNWWADRLKSPHRIWSGSRACFHTSSAAYAWSHVGSLLSETETQRFSEFPQSQKSLICNKCNIFFIFKDGNKPTFTLLCPSTWV